jgi:germacradienol/geosmin synthase
MQSSRYMNKTARDEQAAMTMLTRPTGLGSAAARLVSFSPESWGLTRLRSFIHQPLAKVGPTTLPDFYMPYEARVNDHLEQSRTDCVEWARAMGFYTKVPGNPWAGVWTEQQNVEFDFAQCSARLHPDAGIEALNVATRWLCWGTYGDDGFPKIYGASGDLTGAKVCNARLMTFMPLDCASMPPPMSPLEAGLADLWLVTATPLPLEGRVWLRTGIEEMTESWIWEVQNQIQQRVPDPIDYIEMRRRTFGSDLTMSFARISHGGNLPPEIFETRPMLGLENASQDYACLLNDVFSYQKEVQFEGDLHNLVYVVQNFLGVTPEQAVKVVNDLMTARLKQFENIIETELPYLVEQFGLDETDQATLDGWVEMMQDWMAGILIWHQMTGRYKEPNLLKTATPGALIAAGGSRVGEPAGLGTDGARLGQAHDPPEPPSREAVEAVLVGAFSAVPTGLGTAAASLGQLASSALERIYGEPASPDPDSPASPDPDSIEVSVEAPADAPVEAEASAAFATVPTGLGTSAARVIEFLALYDEPASTEAEPPGGAPDAPDTADAPGPTYSAIPTGLGTSAAQLTANNG